MTDQSLVNKSRKEANNMMRVLHPEVNWHSHCVHHIDKNPFNNSISNLQITTPLEHAQFHCKNVIHKPDSRGYLLNCGHYVKEDCPCWDQNNIQTTKIESTYPCGCKVVYEKEDSSLKMLYFERGFSCNLPHEALREVEQTRTRLKK